MSDAIALRALTAHVYRAPLASPVVTSFGTMRDRPMVLVRAEDRDGTVGWGEIWCNFPAVGAEHRARLVASAMAPLAVGAAFDDPAQCFAHLSDRLAVLALQSGEPGPFAQAIAGVDIALWDLVARRRREPLWHVLGGVAADIGVYASGLNPDDPAPLARERQRGGHRAFKLKVGFGSARDLANLDALRAALGRLGDADGGCQPGVDARRGDGPRCGHGALSARVARGTAALRPPVGRMAAAARGRTDAAGSGRKRRR